MQSSRRMNKLLSLVLVSSLSGGCYLGRSPANKGVAYTANTVLVGVGVTGIATANGDEQQIATMLAMVPIIVGLTGIAINLARSE